MLAEPGGVKVSHAVREAALNRIRAAFDDLGEQTVKNIDQPVHAFRMRWERMTGTVVARQVALDTDWIVQLFLAAAYANLLLRGARIPEDGRGQLVRRAARGRFA